MSNTLSTLGVVVTQTGVNEAKAEILDYGNAGDASAKKVESAFKQASAAGQQMGQSMTAAQRAAQQMGVSLDQVAAAANGDAAAMRALAQASNQATVAATQTSAALTRMSTPSVTFRREIEQTTEAVTRMTAPAVTGFRQMADAQEKVGVAAEATSHLSHSAVIGLGELARGFSNVAQSGQVGALSIREFGGAATRLGGALGIVVILGGAIYEALHKATEEQDKLTKSLEDWYKVESQGPGGERVRQIEAEVAALTKLNDQYQKLKNNAPAPTIGGEGGATIDFGALFSKSTEKDIQMKGGALAAAQRDVTAQLERQQVDALLALQRNNRATEAETERANQALIFLKGRLRDGLNIQGDQTATTSERAAIAGMIDELMDATKAVRGLQEQIDKQMALNTAFGLTAAQLQIIAAQQDAAAQKANEHTHALDALIDRLTTEKIRAIELADAHTKVIAGYALLNAAAENLGRGALAANDPANAIKKQADDAHRMNQELEESKKEIEGTSKAAAEYQRQLNEVGKKITEAQKYSEDLHKIWRDGIAKLTTDGFKSFLDFAQDLEQLFMRLMDRMAQRAKELGKEAGGAAYTALGYGAVALSSGLTGYQIGQSSPSASSGAFNGALGGAATGAAIGSVIPGIGTAIGAIVGGLAGLTGGLLGGAAAARDRAKAEQQLRDSLGVSTAQIKNQLGLISNLELAQAQAKAQFDKQAADINAAYSGKKNEQERNTLLQQNLALEQQYLDLLRQQDAIAKQQQKEDLQVRLLRAQGNASAADALQLQLQQERERDALIKSFGDTIDPTEAATLALLDQVQAQEKLAASSNKVAAGFLNIDDGLKVMADRFHAITPANSYTVSGFGPTLPFSPATPPTSPSSPTSRSTPDGPTPSMTVILNMDGREVARGVVKNLQRKASATLGTTIDWSKVSAN
jgi:hypothetical protein